MSAIVVAVFKDHAAAEEVRTYLVEDGFPTDRVTLTSWQELGQAEVAPAPDTAAKLAQYFEQLFSDEKTRSSIRHLQSAVLSGKAVITVQPRGEVETDRTVEILNAADPVEIRTQHLEKQAFEYAAAKGDSPALNWIGRVLVASGLSARDRGA